MVIHWMLEICNGLSSEISIKSFKSNTSNLMTDGAEYGKIHCFKKDLSNLTSSALLKVAMEALDDKQISVNYFQILNLRSIKAIKRVMDEDYNGDSDIDIHTLNVYFVNLKAFFTLSFANCIWKKTTLC